MRKLLFVVSDLLFLAMVAQLYLGGVGAFRVAAGGATLEEGFSLHAANGRVVLPALALLTLIVAAVARAGKKTVWLAASLVLLLGVQTLTLLIPAMLTGSSFEGGAAGDAFAWMAAVHPVTGALAIVLSGWTVFRAKRSAGWPKVGLGRAAAQQPQASAAEGRG